MSSPSSTSSGFSREGKVKRVYDVSDKEIEFEFTDRISVFDKIIPSKIPFKGETLCREGTFWLKEAEKLGFLTHFIKMTDKNKMLVKKVNIIHDYNKINHNTKNYLIPLEFICRHYVAGSLHDRIEKGKIDPKELGFSKKTVTYGEKIPEPFIETSTKLEPVDRPLDKKEALRISGLTGEEYNNILETIIKMDTRMSKIVEKGGLVHVDGKKEFGMNEERTLMFIDVFGTADEDRFWDKKLYEQGQMVELSKEFVRQYYIKTGYKKELYDAREKGIVEPDIPALPEKLIKEVSDLYINMYERITGEKFR
ncbi:MAG: Phosphoribosylaminoimidazole-succinocarboxamide synthase [Candidatus Methanofastidiosum methylothiophilum]|uniref:Phosphoribosylaminoimidazole-succinocarboxamide synthase n=1 Tax=Candidatus Methanofastidiosum methylothiophilum TaxID=1705564 RepID=A0A150IKB5_9EURY|nr:MAG: Phosphoribosylaminoimidazole-succinocarboxamide synthase [Candidatus Methanofastidiosum methylthiophilus]KYC47358.1 MAG: Phosphoribosylaminoimidazole-succinocarboxamide synthase [Candidatus Methanofastidiosum methylthiophilus]KYC49851.1 MAG: Phosphoribosylaminoimidazole-succinocarboxamide synthase [Candidatus Methanofastidiosum methylthiophilus]